MAQPELKQLYQRLVNTRFAFVPRGKRALHEVYFAVQSQYPDLCNDNFLCSDNCQKGHPSPEWQHVTRKGLREVKKRSPDMVNSFQRGYWNFTEAEIASGYLPEEIVTPEPLYEGAIRQIYVNAYERNPEARKRCIAYYGVSCIVCGFNFADKYGEIGRGFIHVHHLQPLAKIGEAYEVDPIADLRPVCPNCHAIIHRRSPALSIEEAKMLLGQATSNLRGRAS